MNLEIQPPKSPPAAGTSLSVDYSYNNLIERIDAQIDLVRLVGMDTLVHRSDDINLKFNLAIILVPGVSVTDVSADIETNLFAWLNRKSFQNNVQIADVIDVVANASGVDNVRLATASEARNDVQKVTAAPTVSTPSATRDTFTIKIGDDTSGLIAYNETATDVREILEAMPTIHEGNTYATQLDTAIVSTSTTSVSVDDVASLHEDGLLASPELENYFIEVDTEIMEVTSVTDAGATLSLTVKRGQLGSTAVTHLINADVHVLGDVGVSRTGAGTQGDPYVWSIFFLSNLYTGVNDWGTREVDIVVLTKGSDNSKLTLTVVKKVQGVGSGIQQIANNDQTIIDTFYSDFYLASDELPVYFGLDVIARAQNTF